MAVPVSKRFGRLALTILSLGSVLICTCLSLLLFLWTAQPSNSSWQKIVLDNELNNAVSVIAEVLKQAINLQIGVAAAMGAAIALERFAVALPEVASCLAMRSSNYSVWNIALLFGKSAPRRGHILGVNSRCLSLITLILAVIAAIFQASSVLLISDIGLDQTQGFPKLSTMPYGFEYSDILGTTTKRETINPNQSSAIASWRTIDGQSTWGREPPGYPTFAEYHEDSPSYHTDGVDDTGRTLRAFLPYNDANARNTLQNFTGRTTVLDSRVSCQTPNLANISFTSIGNGDVAFMFTGTVTPMHKTERLFNATVFYDNETDHRDEAIRVSSPAPFSCVVPRLNGVAAGKGGTDSLLALCQLVDGGSTTNPQISGGLVSEFVNMLDSNDIDATSAMQNLSRDTGVAYLLLQVQSINNSYWGRAYNATGNADPAVLNQVFHGQWVDIPHRDETSPAGADIQVVSTTLCYAAFDSADLVITATTLARGTGQTDPVPKFHGSNPNSTITDFSDVRKQLLGIDKSSTSSLSLSDRGLLELSPPTSWVAQSNQEKPPIVSYFRNQANLGGPVGVGNTGDLTVALWQLPSDDNSSLPWIKADPHHIALFQQALRSDLGGLGSPAKALQAAITVLSGISYYSELPYFTASADAEQTWFVVVNKPVRARGLIVVVVITFVHLLLMMLVTGMFLRECKLSMLGAEWQSLLQGTRGEAAKLRDVEALDRMRDGEVEELLAGVGKSDMRVGIGRNAMDGRVYLMRRCDPALDINSAKVKRVGSATSSVRSGDSSRSASLVVGLKRWINGVGGKLRWKKRAPKRPQIGIV